MVATLQAAELNDKLHLLTMPLFCQRQELTVEFILKPRNNATL